MRNITLGFLLTLMVCLAGCNTVRGVGQDVQSGGEKLENAADKAQKN